MRVIGIADMESMKQRRSERIRGRISHLRRYRLYQKHSNQFRQRQALPLISSNSPSPQHLAEIVQELDEESNWLSLVLSIFLPNIRYIGCG